MDQNFLFGAIIDFLLFGSIIFAVFLAYKKSLKNAKTRENALASFAGHHYLHFQAVPDPFELGGSYPNGTLKNVISGRLEKSKNQFVLCEQEETRGSGRDQQTFQRTIVCVEIPNTEVQIVVNSKLNNDESSGGNLAQYRRSQRYETEGNFSEFFDVYMPRGSAVETLSFLAPDVMEYILESFSDYDIEIRDDNLFLYTYKILDVSKYAKLLVTTDSLVKELVARRGDAVVRKGQEALARQAFGQKKSIRLRRGLTMSLQTAAFLILIGFFVLATQIKSDSKTDPAALAIMFICVAVLVYIFGKNIREYKLKREYKADVKQLIDEQQKDRHTK